MAPPDCSTDATFIYHYRHGAPSSQNGSLSQQAYWGNVSGSIVGWLETPMVFYELGDLVSGEKIIRIGDGLVSTAPLLKYESVMKRPYEQSIQFLMIGIVAKFMELAKDYTKLGINSQWARVLLVALENGHLRVGQLASRTCIESSTLSHMLRRMEQDGLLMRKRTTDDNRAMVVYLTEKGNLLAKTCQEISIDHEHMIMRHLEPDEAQKLVSKLSLLYKAINE